MLSSFVVALHLLLLVEQQQQQRISILCVHGQVRCETGQALYYDWKGQGTTGKTIDNILVDFFSCILLKKLFQLSFTSLLAFILHALFVTLIRIDCNLYIFIIFL